MNNTVSIITPSFNRANIITETAMSIMQQTYPHWEWMIVDDGSTDNSWEMLQAFAAKDSRIKIFQRDRGPKGACTCRNMAVEKSTGDYLIFLDTDDVLAPFCLEQRVKAMQENPSCDFVIFPMVLFENKLDDLNVVWNVDNDKDDLHRILAGDAVCQGTGPLWKKKSFQQVGMWREDLHLWQDVELHIRSLLWPMKYVKRLDLEPDVYLRVSYSSLSRSGYYSVPKLRSRLIVFTYACDIIQQKSSLEKYKTDLKNMGIDLCISAILGANFLEANQTIEVAKKYGILKAKEITDIKNYLLIRRLKLWKLKAIDTSFFQKVKRHQNELPSNIGKIAWKNKSMLAV